MIIQDLTYYWNVGMTELLQDHLQNWICLQKEAQINSGQRADVSLPPWVKPLYLHLKCNIHIMFNVIYIGLFMVTDYYVNIRFKPILKSCCDPPDGHATECDFQLV